MEVRSFEKPLAVTGGIVPSGWPLAVTGGIVQSGWPACIGSEGRLRELCGRQFTYNVKAQLFNFR